MCATYLSNYERRNIISLFQRQYNAIDFKISSGLKFVLLITDVTPTNQYTNVARYFIYERTTRCVRNKRQTRSLFLMTAHFSYRIKKPLSPKELDENAPFLQYATWSPDGTGVAFVHGNDIYYKPKVQKDLVCRITKTGNQDIYNGVPDWLYESEILKTSHTLWFSPDGLYLMYLSFNDTLVEEYKYTWYDTKNPGTKYPRIKSVRYPKVSDLRSELLIFLLPRKSVLFLRSYTGNIGSRHVNNGEETHAVYKSINNIFN